MWQLLQNGTFNIKTKTRNTKSKRECNRSAKRIVCAPNENEIPNETKKKKKKAKFRNVALKNRAMHLRKTLVQKEHDFKVSIATAITFDRDGNHLIFIAKLLWTSKKKEAYFNASIRFNINRCSCRPLHLIWVHKLILLTNQPTERLARLSFNKTF